ncbi:MAG: DUF4157 domain-containing protein [Scytonema sp. PMC 1070.18]|nr:DUF4157 domain-containing protein [Scytonema sp. PMC 1070.18]
MQRQQIPEEEQQQSVQAKSLASSITPLLQRQQIPEEEQQQPLQAKSLANSTTPLLQRQQMPEEEQQQPLQTKSLANSITPLLQRQQMPEEEQQQPLQTKSLANSITPLLQREEMAQEDEQRAQMKPVVQRKSNGSGMAAASEVETSIKQARGGGQPLSDDIRQPMEQAFGTDFSGVKIHTDSRSHELNESIQARAFTTGQDIFFRQGEYSPGSHSGKELLAHELTHVVQQNGSTVQAKSISNLAKKENKVQAKAVPSKSSGNRQITKPRENSQAVAKSSSEKVPATHAKENPQKQTEGDKQGQPELAEPKSHVEQGEQQGQPSGRKSGLAAPPPTDGGGTGTNPPPVDKQGQQKSKDPKADVGKGVGQEQAIAEKGGAVAGELPGTQADVVTGKVGDVGNGDKAPTTAENDSAFQAVVNTTKEVAETQKEHEPSQKKSQEAQDAAIPPGNEVESKGQANQVGEMGQAETPEFDAAAFKAKLMERIADMAPKNLKEADEFKNNNKLDSVKGDLSGKVEEEQKNSQGQLEEKTKETPDTSGIEPKQVTPLPPTDSGAPPANIGANKASPKSKGQSEVEAPLQEDSKKLDQQMAEQNITEEQLANSNEPEFQALLAAKKDAQTNAVESPQEYRQQEQGILANAQATAEATAQQHLQGMHGIRTQQLNQVADRQVGAKGTDEQARAKVASDINKIYEKTKTQVEKTLSELDGQVQQEFDAGAAEANKAFEDYVGKRMDDYKSDRYGGLFGWTKWIRDQFVGLPDEVNVFYQEGRQLYIEKMDGVINKVVSIISKALTQAKAEIATGKEEIQNYVNQLPQDLKGVGQEAAAQIESKFEELEQSVENKQEELIDTLAQKYQENLEAVDARIEEMKAENRGLIQKAFDFVVGVVKTIIELTKMLMEVLARVAGVVGQILKDPIGFLGNLIQALKQGFLNFMKNIGQHLQQGLIGWLTGTMAAGGIQMPESLDLKGIFSLVTQLLGFTYELIRAQAVKRLGEEKVSHLEQSFEMFRILASEGLLGIWDFIKDRIGDLNALVIEPIKNFVIETVIKAGIEWIIGLLTPASAFIKACKAIYEIVKFFIERAQQIADLINAILDAVGAIASGAIDQAIKGVENALAKSLPVVISFLASLLGLGGIATKIQAIFQKLRKPMEKAVDWIIDKGAKAFKKVGNKFNNSKVGKKFNAAKDAAKEKYKAGKQWVEDKKEAGQKWVNDKKQASEKWVSDKRETVKNKFKQSKLGQKLEEKRDAAKQHSSKKNDVKNKDEKKKTSQSEKNKVDLKDGQIGPTVHFDVPEEKHELLVVLKGSNVNVMMASGRAESLNQKLPTFRKKAQEASNQIALGNITAAENLNRDIRTKVLKRKRDTNPNDVNLNQEINQIKQQLANHLRQIITLLDIAAHEVSPVKPLERFNLFAKDSDFAPVDMTANPRFNNGNGYNYKWVSPQPFQRKHFIDFFKDKKDSEGFSLRFTNEDNASAALNALIKQKKIARLQESPNSYVIIGEQDKTHYVAQVSDTRAAGVDTDLKNKVKDKGGIIGFMKYMTNQVDQNTPEWQKFVIIWDSDPKSKSWLKDQFRDADPGKHEWLPSNMIKAVIERASDAKTYIHGTDWIDFQHEVRTPTKFLIFKLNYANRIVKGVTGVKKILQGHSGAVYTSRPPEGPKQETDKQKEWHDTLRGFFSNTNSLKQLLQEIEQHFDNTIWDGTPVDRVTTYDRHCDAKGNLLSLNDLEAQQQREIPKVKSDFMKWKVKFPR